MLFKNSSLWITDILFYFINNFAAVGTDTLWDSSPCLDLYLASSQSQLVSIKSKEFMTENNTKGNFTYYPKELLNIILHSSSAFSSCTSNKDREKKIALFLRLNHQGILD